MLSRIAESLFWIGRYIERSDGTALFFFHDGCLGLRGLLLLLLLLDVGARAVLG